ncbi:MAG: glycerol-3-phosphate acyltransferase, partial [Bacteroidota bacterium]
MTVLFVALGLIIAYFMGSIPTAIWFGRAVYNTDVRQHGSGNPGATNTFRVLGTRAGTIVMLGDIIKGLLATSIATLLMH